MIKASFERIRENAECDPQRAFYAEIAVQCIDAFDGACQASNWDVGVEKLLAMATDPPSGLPEAEEEGYAMFVHQTMKIGDCHGMAHEDPIGANAVIGGALGLYRKLIVERRRQELLPHALDLMLLQGVAYMVAGVRDIARMQFLSIIDLTASEASAQDRPTDMSLPADVVNSLQDEVVLRAAPSAFMLAEIFREEDDNERAESSMELAHMFFAAALAKGDEGFIGSKVDLITAKLAQSELLTQKDGYWTGADALDDVIALVEADLDENDPYPAYCFLISVVMQRRAQLFAMDGTWDPATYFYERACRYAVDAIRDNPTNTHYLDHYTDLLNELGIFYGVRENPIKAQGVFLTAIEKKRELVERSKKYEMGLATCINNLSTLMRTFGKPEVALPYLEEAASMLDASEEVETEGIRTFKAAVTKDLEHLRAQVARKNKRVSRSSQSN